MSGDGGRPPSVESVFRDLADHLAATATNVSFRPGQSERRVLAMLSAAGIEQPDDDLVEWFCLQDGLEHADDRLFFDFQPAPLADLVADNERARASYEEIAEDLPEVRELDYFPQPTWFPLSVGGGRFIVDNVDARRERVYRHWHDQLEYYGADLVAFLSEGLRAQRRGPTPIPAGSSGDVLYVWQRDREFDGTEPE